MAKGETQHYVFVFDDGQLSSSLGGHALFSRSRHHRADGRQGSASPSKAPLASLWDAWLTKVPTWNNSKQPALGEQGGHNRKTSRLKKLPIGSCKGNRVKHYVWDGRRIRAVDPAVLRNGETRQDRLSATLAKFRSAAYDAIFPNPRSVTPDYWHYVSWRASHRLFSSMLGIFATQSLLSAVGIGAQRSLPAAAAINWVLKDGLGRLGRLGVAAAFGQSFDADVKRFRFSTSVLFTAAVSLEYMTPLMPRYFLPLASLANVGKSVGLTTYIATQPVFLNSFIRHENLADINAKTQAQSMVMDTLGLAISVTLTWLTRNSAKARQALPLVAFPLLAAGDLVSIYYELKAIHLRSLNHERAELIAAHWLAYRRVPSARQVSADERLLGPSRASQGVPLTICSLEKAVRTPGQLATLMERHSDDRYLLSYDERPRRILGVLPIGGHGQLRLTLRDDATPPDILQGIMHAACFRRLLLDARLRKSQHSHSAVGTEVTLSRVRAGERDSYTLPVSALLDSSRLTAESEAANLMQHLPAQQWQPQPFLLSSSERGGYTLELA